MEWTPARIRLLRDVALCQSQYDFARALGFDKRTIGNAERGTHPRVWRFAVLWTGRWRTPPKLSAVAFSPP